MNESWVQFLIAGGVGFIVWELRMLRKELSVRVHYRDCDRRMASTEKDIGEIKKLIF